MSAAPCQPHPSVEGRKEEGWPKEGGGSVVVWRRGAGANCLGGPAPRPPLAPRSVSHRPHWSARILKYTGRLPFSPWQTIHPLGTHTDRHRTMCCTDNGLDWQHHPVKVLSGTVPRWCHGEASVGRLPLRLKGLSL